MALNIVFNLGESLGLAAPELSNLSMVDEKVRTVVYETLPAVVQQLKSENGQLSLAKAVSLVGRALFIQLPSLFFMGSSSCLNDLRFSFAQVMLVLAVRNCASNPSDKKAQGVAIDAYASLFNILMKKNHQGSKEKMIDQRDGVATILAGNLRDLLKRSEQVFKGETVTGVFTIE
jgi:hypothetical protein